MVRAAAMKVARGRVGGCECGLLRLLLLLLLLLLLSVGSDDDDDAVDAAAADDDVATTPQDWSAATISTRVNNPHTASVLNNENTGNTPENSSETRAS